MQMSEKLIVPKKTSVKEHFHIFVKTTKAHGFNKIHKFKNRLPLLILWLMVLLFLLGVFAYNLYIVTVNYLQVPMSTTYSYAYITNDWPAITLCQDNPYSFVSNGTNIVPNYNTSFQNLTTQMQAFWDKAFPNQTNLVASLALQSILPFGISSYGFTDIITPILICSAQQPNRCPSFSRTSLFPLNGAICATLNIRDGNFINNIGVINLIYVWMPMAGIFYQPQWPLWNTFLNVYIHPNNTFPYGGKYGAMDINGDLVIDVERSQTTTDSTTVKACLTSPPDLSIMDMAGNVRVLSYTQNLCTMLATQRVLRQTCGCFSEMLAIPGEFSDTFGRNFEIFCHHLTMGNLQVSNTTVPNDLQNKINCHDNVVGSIRVPDCQIPCQMTIYRGSSFYNKGPVGTQLSASLKSAIASLIDPIQQKYFTPATCLQTDYLSTAKCTVLIQQVLRISLRFKVEVGSAVQTVSYGIMNYFSDVAGLVGLYAGYSTLTVLEFLDFMRVSTASLIT